MVFRHVVLMVFFPVANHLAYIYTKVGADDHCGAGKEKVLFPCLRIIVFVIYELRSIFLR